MERSLAFADQRGHQIHASTVNCDADSVIRLSTDLRFYDPSRPYDEV